MTQSTHTINGLLSAFEQLPFHTTDVITELLPEDQFTTRHGYNLNIRGNVVNLQVVRVIRNSPQDVAMMEKRGEGYCSRCGHLEWTFPFSFLHNFGGPKDPEDQVITSPNVTPKSGDGNFISMS